MSDIDNESMKDLENEHRIATVGSRARRVKIEKGESWLVRFIPFPMGKNGAFYARIAYHWIDRKSTLCIRNTGPAFGGDPDYDCPVCAAANKLYNETASEPVRLFAYKAMGHPRWRTLCLVVEKNNTSIEGEELYLPYEFDLSKTTFTGWSDMLLRDQKKGTSKQGFLDLDTGCDILASRPNIAIQLQRENAGPILGISDNDKLDRVIDRIWKRCSPPQLTLPARTQLVEAADRIRDKIGMT
jgi:hypothetical protein